MSDRRRVKIQVRPDGTVYIVDPDESLAPLLGSLGRRVQESVLARSEPRLAATRRIRVPIPDRHFDTLPLHALLEIDRRYSGRPDCTEGEASLLDLKVEVLRRWLRRCTLCWKRCVVDRAAGEVGRCGLGVEAVVGEHFLHLAEEPAIAPSYLIALQGCSWRCRYCQQHQLLSVDPARGRRLDEFSWEHIDLARAKTLTFIGGNPDESAYAIVRWLRALPEDFPLPIVWNTHGSGSPRLYQLLDGVVDFFVPDLRYGNDACAERWSGVTGYRAAASVGLRAMAATSAEIIVRILVLPGHADCCHLPALRLLAAKYRDRVSVSIKGEYYPTFLIGERDGRMAGRPLNEEAEIVRTTADEFGLRCAGERGAPEGRLLPEGVLL